MTEYVLPFTCPQLLKPVLVIGYLMIVLCHYYGYMGIQDNAVQVVVFGASGYSIILSYWLLGAVFGYGMPSRVYDRIETYLHDHQPNINMPTLNLLKRLPNISVKCRCDRESD